MIFRKKTSSTKPELHIDHEFDKLLAAARKEALEEHVTFEKSLKNAKKESRDWMHEFTKIHRYTVFEYRKNQLQNLVLQRKVYSSITAGVAGVAFLAASPFVMAAVGLSLIGQPIEVFMEHQIQKRTIHKPVSIDKGQIIVSDKRISGMTQHGDVLMLPPAMETVDHELIDLLYRLEGDSSYHSQMKGLMLGAMSTVGLTNRGGSNLHHTVAGVWSGNTKGSLRQRAQEFAIEQHLNSLPEKQRHQLILASACSASFVRGCTLSSYALFKRPIKNLSYEEKLLLAMTSKKPLTDANHSYILNRALEFSDNNPDLKINIRAFEATLQSAIFMNPFSKSLKAMGEGWTGQTDIDQTLDVSAKIRDHMIKLQQYFGTKGWVYEVSVKENANTLYRTSNEENVQKKGVQRESIASISKLLVVMADGELPQIVYRRPFKVDGELHQMNGETGDGRAISIEHALGKSDNFGLYDACRQMNQASLQGMVDKYGLMVAGADLCASLATGNLIGSTDAIHQILNDALNIKDPVKRHALGAAVLLADGTLSAYRDVLAHSLNIDTLVAKTGTEQRYGAPIYGKIIAVTGESATSQNLRYSIVIRLSPNGQHPICLKSGCLPSRELLPIMHQVVRLVE